MLVRNRVDSMEDGDRENWEKKEGSLVLLNKIIDFVFEKLLLVAAFVSMMSVVFAACIHSISKESSNGNVVSSFSPVLDKILIVVSLSVIMGIMGIVFANSTFFEKLNFFRWKGICHLYPCYYFFSEMIFTLVLATLYSFIYI